MAHDPPQGKELKTTKQIEKIVRKLDKGIFGNLKTYTPDVFYACISSGHALEGVRVNGVRKLTNVLTTYKNLQESKKDMDRYVKRVSKASEQINKALLEVDELMEGFTICPKCKGQKGQKLDKEENRYGPGESIIAWRDCERCGGRGIFPKSE